MRKRFTRQRLGEGLELDLTDWQRLDGLSEADIGRAIDADPDSIELRPGWLKNAVVVQPARPKQQTTIRFDADLLDWFKSHGRGYQTLMNAVLRAYYETHRNKDG